MNAHVWAEKLLHAYLTSALDGSSQVYGLAALTPNTYWVLLVYCCNKIRGGSFSLQIKQSIIRIAAKHYSWGRRHVSIFLLNEGKESIVCYEMERRLCFANCQGQHSSPGEHFRISFYQEMEQDHFSAQLETMQRHTLYHRTFISESTHWFRKMESPDWLRSPTSVFWQRLG